MSATVRQFEALLDEMGTDVLYHREDNGTSCPCRTPEGFRDPAWHRAHPASPVCNEQGFLTTPVEFMVKAAIQPASPRAFRRASDRINDLFGDIETGDHLGVFPVTWNGHTLDFYKWSEAGEDYIVYDGRRFIVVGAEKLPDIDGDPNHHYEVALRWVKGDRPNA